jgi:hypothetical protein
MLPNTGPHAYARYNSYYRSESAARRPAPSRAAERTGERRSARSTGIHPVPLRDQT